MTLREFRRRDASRFFELLKREFPEEEAILGTRPEGFERLIRRLYRPPTRLLLGVLKAVHRSPFHLYVVDEGDAIAGSALLAFAPRTGFLSNVVVAPAYRRRGLARAMLEAARRETAKRGRPYVALRVLASNAPARALYGSLGYRELDRQLAMVLDQPPTGPAGAADRAIRPFAPSDAERLVELANRRRPPAVQQVLPLRARDLAGASWADRLFEAQTAAWVVDRGHGPEAYLAATSTPLTEAAHLGTPIVDTAVEPALAVALVRTATGWLATRRPARVIVSVAADDPLGRRALEDAGFRDAYPHFTLYRASA